MPVRYAEGAKGKAVQRAFGHLCTAVVFNVFMVLDVLLSYLNVRRCKPKSSR